MKKLPWSATAANAVGFRWSTESGRMERVNFERSTYLVTSAEHDESFCPDRRYLCISWRNITEAEKPWFQKKQCNWVNKGQDNERLSCSDSKESLTIDLKRGVYTLAKDGGTPTFGVSFGGRTDPEDGLADDTYVEHGACNSIPTD